MLAIPSFIIYFVSFLFVFFYNYKISNIYLFIPFRSVRVQYYFNWNASKMKIPSLDTRSWVWKIGLIFGLFFIRNCYAKELFFSKNEEEIQEDSITCCEKSVRPTFKCKFYDAIVKHITWDVRLRTACFLYKNKVYSKHEH